MVERITNSNPASQASSSRVSIEVLDSWEQLKTIKTEWDALLERSSAASVFLTYEWLRSWWSAFSAGYGLHFLAFRAASGQLIGLAGLMERRRWPGMREALFAGDQSSDSDNLSVVAEDRYIQEVANAFAECVARDERWDFVTLSSMRGELSMTRALSEAFMKHGLDTRGETSAHLMIPLQETFESFSARLSPKMRDGIKSRRKLIEKSYEIEASRCTDETELREALEVLRHLHIARWQMKGMAGALTDNRPGFYEQMAAEFLRKGWLEFWVLRFSGRPVASQIGFIYQNQYSHLQSGFDPEYARYSPGSVLIEEIIKSLIARGVAVYDFLAGDEPYKRRWGVEDNGYLRLTIVGRGWRPRVASAAEGASHASFGALRRLTPRPMWNAMRAAYRAIKGPQ